MKNITEHSKKLRLKTTADWKKKKVTEGAYNYNVLIKDPEIVEKAKKIENKTQFLIEAIKKYCF